MQSAIKISGWTLGMAAAAFLILDGKSVTENAWFHVVFGSVVGFVLGCVFSRNKPVVDSK